MRIGVAGALALFLNTATAGAAEIGIRVETPCPSNDCAAGIAFTYLGEFSLPTGHREAGIEFGGISGLDYDAARGVYIALSDDRAERGPVRVHDLDIDVGADGLKGVKVLRTMELRDRGDAAFAANGVDPEAIRVTPHGHVWTSEGVPKAGLPAFVRVAAPDGGFVREFTLPPAFAPAPGRAGGIRADNGLESLTVLPDGDVLAGLEAALLRDGPAASLTGGSLSRLVRFDAETGMPKAQYVYVVEPIPLPPARPGAWADNGLSELLALDGRRLLALERGFSLGAGNTIRIFLIDLEGAGDVSGLDSLVEARDRVVPVRKCLVLDLGALGVAPDNIEAMALGRGRDGAEVLVLAADNNFNPTQKTQFLAFRVDRRPGRRGDVIPPADRKE